MAKQKVGEGTLILEYGKNTEIRHQLRKKHERRGIGREGNENEEKLLSPGVSVCGDHARFCVQSLWPLKSGVWEESSGPPGNEWLVSA